MKTHDLALLDRWRQRRDAEAFRELVSRHAGMVYATCRRILGNAADAEDIAQDCFVELATRPARPRRSVGGWLHALATHRALDKIRAESRRRVRETQYGAPATARTQPQLLEHVDEALADLDDAQRTLLVLHFFEGRSHDEIAHDIGLSRSTVTRRIARGVEQVRERLRAKGIAIPVAGLGLALAGLKAEAAPAATVTALGKIAIAGGGATPMAAAGAGMLFAKIAAVSALMLVGVGAFFAVSRPANMTPATAPTSQGPDSTRTETRGIDETADPTDASALSGAQPSPTHEVETEIVDIAAGRSSIASGASIEGVVLDLQGRPVPEARVDCYGVGRDFPGSTQIFTDEQGRFRYEDVPPADVFQIYASTDEPRRQSKQQDLERVAAGEHYDLVLVLHEARVTGRVVDAANRPIPGADVMAQPVKPAFHGISADTADVAGRFSIAGLAEGEYVLKTNRPGGRTPWPHDGIHVTLGPSDVRDNVALVLDSEPGPIIAGRITDAAGAGVFDVHVQANLPGPPYHSQWARTNADGFYAVEGLVEGTYRVSTSHPDYGNAYRMEVAAGSASVDMVLEPRGAIHGRVVDAATGFPVSDFEVFENTRLSDVHHHMVTQEFRGVRDSRGRFSLDKVGPGETPVRVRAEGYAERTERVDVPAGAVAEPIIALKRSRPIEGLVVDAAGKPVAGAQIFAGKLPHESDRQQLGSVRSDEHGHFTLATLDPDQTLISCYHPRYAAGHASVSTDDFIRIELDSGVEVRGTITVDGVPAPWAHVSVFYPAWSGSVDGARVDENGTYSLASVSREGGVLSVGLPGEDGAAKRHLTKILQIDPAQDAVTIDLDLINGPGLVQGTVYEDGKPRGGLFMVFQMDARDGWTEDFSTHSGLADGRYRFDGVPAGGGVVRVYPIGAPQERDPVEAPVTVGEGEAVTCDVVIPAE